ncbi:MAG: peptidase MA family metallohydrolase [Candidatus Omnitrophota bacterium]
MRISLKNFKWVVAGCFLTAIFGQSVLGQDWQDIKGKHFVVYFQDGRSAYAQRVLRLAETYYRNIGDQIGYSRYSDFWTWNERVEIFIFPDQEKFVQKTGQPAWSLAYVDREKRLSDSRTIAFYAQGGAHPEGLLAHEISHLVLRDFLGDQTPIPSWFDEGVAQLQETDKPAVADRVMRSLVRKGSYIPLRVFINWDIRREEDAAKVQVFYAQSVSLVDFLIKNYGSEAFGRLCRSLREGKNFEEALRSVYSRSIETLDDLERKWVSYLKDK